MKRRDFVILLGGVTAWPLAARAQAAMPMIGLLDVRAPETNADQLRAFRQGLREIGYVEGENVSIIYRWADNQVDRLPDLAAELVRRRVAVIVTAGGTAAHFAAKKASTTIPVVFSTAADPVAVGLVSSLARPDGNLTGVNFFGGELTAKRLALLHELLPTVKRIAVLVNPGDATSKELTLRDAQPAVQTLGLQMEVHNASTSGEIDSAFSAFELQRPDAVFVAQGGFFMSRRVQLAQMAARHALPTSYPQRDFVEVGGLMSYGANVADSYRQVGIYTGRILKGARPADLPVVQASRFDLVINRQTARMQNITVPSTFLALADEIIE